MVDSDDNRLSVWSFLLRGVFKALVQKHFPSEKQRREKARGNKRKRTLTKIVKTLGSSGEVFVLSGPKKILD